jgi:gliding motility-associated-like protein
LPLLFDKMSEVPPYQYKIKVKTMSQLYIKLPSRGPAERNTRLVKAVCKCIIALFAGLLPGLLFAQAPTVSYSGPQTYYTGNAISTLAPMSSNVAAPAYSLAKPKLIDSGFFDSSYGLAIDAGGNLFLPGYTENQIFEVTANSHTSHNVVAAINKPYGMAVDAAGNLYTCKFDLGQVYRISGGSQFLIASGLNTPVAVAADSKGNVYVADYGTNTLWKIPIAGGPLVSLGTYSGISYVMVDAYDNLYFNNTSYIEEIPAGSSTAVSVPTSIGFAGINAIAIDGAGNMFVTNNNSTIDEVLGGTGGHTVAIASGFGGVGGIAVDGFGHVFATDGYTQSVKILTPLGGYFITPTLPAGLSFDGATGNITGTPTVASPAKNYTITAYNSQGVSATTKVNIAVLQNTATLAQLQLSSGTLSPAFSATTTSYTANLGNGFTSVTVKPTIAHAGATVTVNGTTVASGAKSGPITLPVGQTTITTVVNASGGAPTNTYTITVTRAASSNATLSNLKINAGIAISPVFAPSTTTYNATVPNGTGSITITPTTADANATVTVNGSPVTSKTASDPIYLSVGLNPITTEVTAQDGTIVDYTINVTRTPSSDANLSALVISPGALSPSFTPGNTSYSVSVANNVNWLNLRPTGENATATITVGDEQVQSGTEGEPISLNVGTNTINIMMAASDGTTTQTYTLTVTRAASSNAYLQNLRVSTGTLSPAFHYTTNGYTVEVPNATTSISVTAVLADETATMTIEGTPATSRTAVGPITLATGVNSIAVNVTAQDGTPNNYLISVTRDNASMNIPDASFSFEQPVTAPQLSEDGIVVHNGVSPNGDGLHDFLKIDGITAFPDNKLIIMNRSGLLVFEEKGYDNSSKIFDGHSNKTGQLQTPGTYFYSLAYTVKGITKHKTGFIVLKY